jgi:hypothetical protein
MSANTIIIITPEDLKDLIREAVEAALEARGPKDDRAFTINKVALMLHRSHKTIGEMLKAGVFKATVDGKIYESSVNQYLTTH